MKKSWLVKLAVGVLLLGGFGLLFVRSLEDTASAPFTVARSHLGGWRLAVEPAARPGDPLLVLHAPAELSSGLFRQVFSRSMESLVSPAGSTMPVVLKGEYDTIVADQLTPEALENAARQAALEASPITPRCLVHRRVSEPGNTRQVYFAVFDAPGVLAFRQQIGLDAGAQAPLVFIAAAAPDFNSWLPQRIDLQADCVAPIEVEE